MKKRLIRITTIVMITAILVQASGGFNKIFKSPTAEAVGDLSVDWGVTEGNPIFVVNNMAPGDDETRTVDVHNDASSSRPVGVRGIKTSETGNLSQVFDFVISENGTDLYGGTSPTGPKTLADFFTDSAGVNGIFLSDLASGSSTSYVFTATFRQDSGNEFQARQLVFDLKIGIIIDLPAECDALNLVGNPIFGTENNDHLIGTQNNDLIISFEGNDHISSGSGNDCVISGPGNDRIIAGSDNDVVFADEGNDRIEGGSGNDKMFGGAGNDNIDSGSGNDRAEGGTGNDNLDGGADNDILLGQEDHDVAKGGSGTDTCVAETRHSCEL